MTMTKERFRFARKVAGWHLLICATFALIVGGLMFSLFYPAPYRDLMGSFKMFYILVVVDVCCGPLLTFILSNPKKSVRERWVDYSLVAAIQLAAFIYGAHAVYVGRPAFLVFVATDSDKGNFNVVTANGVYTKDFAKTTNGFKKIPLWGVGRAVLPPLGDDNRKEIQDVLFSERFDSQQRPLYWIPYEQGRELIRKSAQPLAPFIAMQNTENQELLRQAVKKTGKNEADLWYVPFQTPEPEWTAILDKDMNMLEAVPVDSWVGLPK